MSVRLFRLCVCDARLRNISDSRRHRVLESAIQNIRFGDCVGCFGFNGCAGLHIRKDALVQGYSRTFLQRNRLRFFINVGSSHRECNRFTQLELLVFDRLGNHKAISHIGFIRTRSICYSQSSRNDVDVVVICKGSLIQRIGECVLTAAYQRLSASHVIRRAFALNEAFAADRHRIIRQCFSVIHLLVSSARQGHGPLCNVQCTVDCGYQIVAYFGHHFGYDISTVNSRNHIRMRSEVRDRAGICHQHGKDMSITGFQKRSIKATLRQCLSVVCLISTLCGDSNFLPVNLQIAIDGTHCKLSCDIITIFVLNYRSTVHIHRIISGISSRSFSRQTFYRVIISIKTEAVANQAFYLMFFAVIGYLQALRFYFDFVPCIAVQYG